MAEIIVPEDPLFSAARPNPSDHRGMVLLIRQDEAIRQQPADPAKRCFIGYVAGREGEGRLLAVQVGEFARARDDGMAVAGDVAGTSGAGAASIVGGAAGLGGISAVAFAPRPPPDGLHLRLSQGRG